MKFIEKLNIHRLYDSFQSTNNSASTIAYSILFIKKKNKCFNHRILVYWLRSSKPNHPQKPLKWSGHNLNQIVVGQKFREMEPCTSKEAPRFSTRRRWHGLQIRPSGLLDKAIADSYLISWARGCGCRGRRRIGNRAGKYILEGSVGRCREDMQIEREAREVIGRRERQLRRDDRGCDGVSTSENRGVGHVELLIDSLIFF